MEKFSIFFTGKKARKGDDLCLVTTNLQESIFKKSARFSNLNGTLSYILYCMYVRQRRRRIKRAIKKGGGRENSAQKMGKEDGAQNAIFSAEYGERESFYDGATLLSFFLFLFFFC